jgi:predicted SAM-dependent methyltransferase
MPSMGLYDQAIRKYKENGAQALLGSSLQYLGRSIETDSLLQQKQSIIESYADSPFYLNVGGGQFIREHWRVLDFYSDWYDYEEEFIDYNVNLEDLSQWPIENDTVDLIYTAHTLEHLSDAAVRHTLRECARVLQPEGTIRISVPDIDLALRHYERENAQWFTEFRPNSPPEKLYSTRHGQDEYVMEEYLLTVFATHLTNARRSGTTDDHCADFERVQSDYESLSKHAFFQKYSDRIKNKWQDENPGLHRNWFDYQRLLDLLSEAGFENIHKECSQQSNYVEFNNEEFGKRPYLSLHVEASWIE